METIKKVLMLLNLNFMTLVEWSLEKLTAIKLLFTNAKGIDKVKVVLDVVISLDKLYKDSGSTKDFIKSRLGTKIDDRDVVIVTDDENPIDAKLLSLLHSMYPNATYVDIKLYAFNTNQHVINLTGVELVGKTVTESIANIKTI